MLNFCKYRYVFFVLIAFLFFVKNGSGQERVTSFAKGKQEVIGMSTVWKNKLLIGYQYDRSIEVYQLAENGSQTLLSKKDFGASLTEKGVLYKQFFYGILDNEAIIYNWVTEEVVSYKPTVCADNNCFVGITFSEGNAPAFISVELSLFEFETSYYNIQHDKFITFDNNEFNLKGANEELIHYQSSINSTQNYIYDFKYDRVFNFQLFNVDNQVIIGQKVYFTINSQLFLYDLGTNQYRPIYQVGFNPTEVIRRGDHLLIARFVIGGDLMVDIYNIQKEESIGSYELKDVNFYRTESLEFDGIYLYFNDSNKIKIRQISGGNKSLELIGERRFYVSNSSVYFFDEKGLSTFGVNTQQTSLLRLDPGNNMTFPTYLELGDQILIFSDRDNGDLIHLVNTVTNSYEEVIPNNVLVEGLKPHSTFFKIRSKLALTDDEDLYLVDENVRINKHPLNEAGVFEYQEILYAIEQSPSTQILTEYNGEERIEVGFIPNAIGIDNFFMASNSMYFEASNELWHLDLASNMITLFQNLIVDLDIVRPIEFDGQVFYGINRNVFIMDGPNIKSIKTMDNRGVLFKHKESLYWMSNRLLKYDPSTGKFESQSTLLFLESIAAVNVRYKKDLVLLDILTTDDDHIYFTFNGNNLDDIYAINGDFSLVNLIAESNDFLLFSRKDPSLITFVDINEGVFYDTDLNLPLESRVNGINITGQDTIIEIVTSDGQGSLIKMSNQFNQQEEVAELEDPLMRINENSLYTFGEYLYTFGKFHINLLRSANDLNVLDKAYLTQDRTNVVKDKYLYFLGYDTDLGKQVYRYELDGVNDVKEAAKLQTIIVYPSLANNTVYVKVASTEVNGITLKIINAKGHLVESIPATNDFQVDVSNYTPGIYYIKIGGVPNARASFIKY